MCQSQLSMAHGFPTPYQRGGNGMWVISGRVLQRQPALNKNKCCFPAWSIDASPKNYYFYRTSKSLFTDHLSAVIYEWSAFIIHMQVLKLLNLAKNFNSHWLTQPFIPGFTKWLINKAQCLYSILYAFSFRCIPHMLHNSWWNRNNFCLELRSRLFSK